MAQLKCANCGVEITPTDDGWTHIPTRRIENCDNPILGEPATETTPMFMVVTLKSGVQIRTEVSEYTVRRTRADQLVGLKWQATESTEASIEHLDMAEVAAVHTEWPKA
jgi:hypothetical protein